MRALVCKVVDGEGGDTLLSDLVGKVVGVEGGGALCDGHLEMTHVLLILVQLVHHLVHYPAECVICQEMMKVWILDGVTLSSP